jgi:hypothetical protein
VQHARSCHSRFLNPQVGRVGLEPTADGLMSPHLPAALVRVADLGRYEWIRSWLPRFGHVFGMIEPPATEYRWSRLRAVANLPAVLNVEDVCDAAALIDQVDDAIGAAPGSVASGERPV